MAAGPLHPKKKHMPPSLVRGAGLKILGRKQGEEPLKGPLA